jgi:hypothetical protein
MADARISISLREGNIEIEGSESFVIAQLTRFESLITKALEQAVKPAAGGKGKPAGGGGDDETDSIENYPNLFAIADGKVQITRDLLGTNKAQKSVNAALLLAYANSLKGSNTTTFSAVRDLCSAHACLDEGNFAKTMRDEKEAFIVGGSGKSRTLELSVPGRKKARALAQQLNGA